MQKPVFANEILDALEALWGREKSMTDAPDHEEPLDGLVLTVLSQNTNDRNRDVAFARLKEDYPTWDKAALATPADIADLIRVAGLGDTKAVRIKQILDIVKNKFGTYSIKGLTAFDYDAARSFLVSLPGVGVKTAGVVLMFEFNMPAFPVDTHIARISKRLGWALEKESPEKIQLYLEETLPKSRFRGAHLNFLDHGRNICKAQKPKCAECSLKPWCDYAKGQKNTDAE